MTQVNATLLEIGKKLALSPFHNPSLKVFIREELELVDVLGIDHTAYHTERVVVTECATAFAIRAYLPAGDLSDLISQGFSAVLQAYGASAADRSKLIDLIQKRIGRYGYAATVELMSPSERGQDFQNLAATFASVLTELRGSSDSSQSASNLAEKYMVPLWHQQVELVGRALQDAGISIQMP